MKIENGIAFPDGTDQSANFRHKVFTDENGKNFFLFPVRVKDERDLKTFGVNKTARWTLPFGPSPLKYQVLYFVAENEDLAEDFWKKINTEHSQESRKVRCLIPGKLRPTIICPEENRCSRCPYPECRDKHEMREIVYDDEIKVSHSPSIESPEIRNLHNQWELEDVCKMLSDVNPLYTEAITLKVKENLSVEEIADIMGRSPEMVRYYLRQATMHGKQIKKEYYRCDWHS